ncbi:hypothetical protein PG990_004262 [Apiospora arundinis]
MTFQAPILHVFYTNNTHDNSLRKKVFHSTVTSRPRLDRSFKLDHGIERVQRRSDWTPHAAAGIIIAGSDKSPEAP